MKHTDLMHGDWFRSKKGTCRINEIRLFTAIVEYSDEAYRDNGNVSSEEVDFEYGLEPLPITKEILEANGFIRKQKRIEFCMTCAKDWNLKILKWDRMEGVNLRISFVHELQHALRLMRQQDFADNFKIEKGDGK